MRASAYRAPSGLYAGVPAHVNRVLVALDRREIGFLEVGPGRWEARTCPACRSAELAITEESVPGGQRASLYCAGVCSEEAVLIALELAAQALETPRHLELASTEPQVPDDFFDGTRFVPSRLGERLRREYPTAIGGRQLYAFIDGFYQPAEFTLERRCVNLLGERWKTRAGDEAITYLQRSSDRLWDSPPLDRIAVSNGILTLADRTLRPPSPEFLSPVRISAAYAPDAECPAVDRFLEQVFPECPELLHELLGHLMVPDISRQRAFMLLGPGGNGKSTVLALIRAFLGPQNLGAVSLHDLEDNRFATADLYGKLANIYADLDARALASTGIFKSITGGDPIRAERKNRDPFSFVPYSRLVFSANEPPATRDSSNAFFDRWEIVPFTQRFRGSDKARDQAEMLRELTSPGELSGLLNRALDGLERLNRTRRFTTADSVAAAAVEFRRSADSVAAFLDEECIVESGAHVTRKQLWDAYTMWCRENNRGTVSHQRFTMRLRELHPQLETRTVQGIRGWSGLRLGGA